MTFRHALTFLCGAGLYLLAACGQTPSEHTIIDYESLEPRSGHGADYDEEYRYGHTNRRHGGTGIDRD